MVGPSSGPKLEMNLLDLGKAMQGVFIRSTKDIPTQPQYNLFCNLHEFSRVLEEWRAIRLYTLKRPFLSTIEKFPRIFQAEYFISSAFHDNFCFQMLYIAEHAGYKNIIIIHKGREGTLGFSLAKPTVVYFSQKQKNGLYKRLSREYSLKDIHQVLEADGRVAVSVEENKHYIECFLQNKDISNENFQKWKKRIAITQYGIGKSMQMFGLPKTH